MTACGCLLELPPRTMERIVSFMDLSKYLMLCVAAFLAAAISASAGFGGALILLPVLVHLVGAKLAVPLLTIMQLVGNFSRVAFGFLQIHRPSVRIFLSAAVPAAVLGALSFASIPASGSTRLIGMVLLIFAALKLKPGHGRIPENRFLLGGGLLTGAVSGLAGSAGPLGAAVFLSLRLSPVAYVASEAVTALVIHSAKTLVYHQRMEVPASIWLLAAAPALAMISGTWASKRWFQRLPPERFRRIVTLLLAAVGAHMVWRG